MVKKRDATMAEIDDQNDDFKVAKVLQREPSEDIYELLDDHYETIAIKDEYIALMEKALDAKDESIAVMKKAIETQNELILKLREYKTMLEAFREEMRQIMENNTRRIALRQNNNDGDEDHTNE